MRKLLFILLLPALHVYAQTLPELLTLTFRHNDAVKSFDFRAQAAESKAGTAGIYPDPQMMFTINQIPWPGGNPVTEAYSQEISVSQMIMTGGKLGSMRNAELKSIPIIEAQKKEYKARLASQIAGSYYNLWIMDQEIELQRRYHHLITKLINLFSAQSSSGSRTAELISLRSESAVAEVNLNKMISERRSMELMLLGQMGISDSLLSGITPSILPSDTLSSLETVMQIHGNPQISVMHAMEEMIEAEKDALSREIYPDLMAELMFMRMPLGMPLTTKTDPDMIHDLGKGETEYMYGLRFSLTLPFLPGYSARVKHSVDEKHLLKSAAVLERENMKRMIERESVSLREEYLTTAEIIKKYKNEVLPLLRQNIGLLESLFSSGQADLNAVLREEKMYIMNEMELLSLIKKLLSLRARYILFTDIDKLSQEGQL
ncbi:MAG: TolC family protein [Ignavibacteriales bacterium]|nr:MAG: TolC family protein [Ignavibacteriales bacterium]